MSSDIEYGELDVTKSFDTNYNYQLIDENALNYDFFHFNAEDFTNDIHIGFSNGFNGHNDKKWEIVIGGWGGTRHVIRDQNQGQALVKITNYDRYSCFLYLECNFTVYIILRTQFDDLKKDFIVEVQDNLIEIFFSKFGDKKELVMSLFDQRIRKSMLNTLVASGGFKGSGSMHIRGVVRKGNQKSLYLHHID